MYILFYSTKDYKGSQCLPYSNLKSAKSKADDLLKKGYWNIKLSKVKEEIIYIPGVEGEKK